MSELALLKHQLDFVADVDTKFIGLVGGYGCGKTKALCVKAIDLASRNVGYEGALFEPTFPQVKRVLIREMDQVLEDLGVPYVFSKGDNYYDLTFAHGTTRIHLLSGENYSRLVGMNLAFFGIDEADVMRLDDIEQLWNQCVARLRRGRVRRGFTTSTPEGFKFLYDFFVTNAGDDRRLIQGKTANNPFLPEDYIPNLKKQYPAHLIQAYLEGQFVNLNNATVYVSFDRDENNTKKTFKDFPNHIIHVGQDFNYGKMATTLSVIDGGVPYFLGEMHDCRDTNDVITRLKTRFSNRQFCVYPDASVNSHTGVSDITLFERAGMKCYFRTKNPGVQDRINSVNALLLNGNNERRMFVNIAECPRLVECLEKQAYIDGKPDKSSGHDHMVDAMGYFIYWHWPLKNQAKARIF